eukprot:867222-Pleurochrysis_carterae.AAC.1
MSTSLTPSPRPQHSVLRRVCVLFRRVEVAGVFSRARGRTRPFARSCLCALPPFRALACVAQTCRELRDRAVAFGKEIDGGKEGGAEDAMAVVCFTHEGGEG